MDFNKIEKKWQNEWSKKKAFEVKEGKGKKFYVNEMYPYPSSGGLHMGHAFNFVVGDIFSRFKRMKGFNVLYPMGYDSFGLPAENAAIKAKSHPKKFTENAIKNFIEQQKSLGLSYDWSRMIMSHDSDYYKWDQWIFLKMFEKGLAYRKKAGVNWCSECKTVLANEQVHDGKCWRHSSKDVSVKQLEQWFLKTTKYADELYEGIDKLKEWPSRIKTLQKNWIGKSHGSEIVFGVDGDSYNFKDKEFVFFHAFQDSSKSVFWNWLKGEIESKGGKVVFTPDFPNSDKPNIDEQIKYVLKNYNFNEKTVLITHSLGGPLAMKLLPKIDSKISKLIMIAPPMNTRLLDGKKRPVLDKCCDWNFDYNEIKNRAKDIIILCDKNDHIVPQKHPREISERLNAKFILGEGNKTHFNGAIEKDVLNIFVGNKNWPIFTTRADTLFGVTFMVVSAQHPRLMELVTGEQKKDVEKFLKKTRSTKQEDMDKLEKEGVFTGSYAVHPLTNEKVPIWAGNFVLADYGSGMVMAVPAHDQRDFDFAKKYGIKIKKVVDDGLKGEMKGAYLGRGPLINSKEFNGLDNEEAKNHITNILFSKKKGRKIVQFRLRDWLISRQRFWGTPIPIIYCDKCGVVPVPEKDLPVKLPENINFSGVENPLIKDNKFLEVKCPECNGKGRRESDTMDTFVNSSWYFLRYTDSNNKKEIFDKKKVNYWAPMDLYIGGAEHAVMHLIYSRFYVKFFRDLGYLKIDEPAVKLFNQGMVHGEDGFVMSKSRGNGVDPLEIVKGYGADVLRMFLVSNASADKDFNWNIRGVNGSLKFINKVVGYFDKVKIGKTSKKVESKLNNVIKKTEKHIETLGYNYAIIDIRDLFNSFEPSMSKKDLESFLKLLSIFCPHVCEELWSRIKGKGLISLSEWPKFDEKKIDVSFEKAEQEAENTVSDILNILKIMEERKRKAEKVYLYVLPKEIEGYDASALSSRIGLEVVVFAVNDSKKYDPDNKSKKVKPGRPGIFVE